MDTEFCVGCGAPMSGLELLHAGVCENCDAGPMCDECRLCEACAELEQDEIGAIADWEMENEID